jgi:hypothetical protein
MILREHTPQQIEAAMLIHKLKKGNFVAKWWMRRPLIFDDGFYIPVKTNHPIKLHPRFAAFDKNYPVENFVFFEILSTILQYSVPIETQFSKRNQYSTQNEVKIADICPEANSNKFKSDCEQGVDFCNNPITKKLLIADVKKYPIPENIKPYLSPTYFS